MHCSTCGYNLTDNDLVCPKCGAVTAVGRSKSELATKATAHNNKPEPPQVRPTVSAKTPTNKPTNTHPSAGSSNPNPSLVSGARQMERKLAAEAERKRRKQKMIIAISAAALFVLLIVILVVMLLVRKGGQPTSVVVEPSTPSANLSVVSTNPSNMLSTPPTSGLLTTVSNTTVAKTVATTPATINEVTPPLVAVLPPNFGMIPSGDYSEINSGVSANDMANQYKAPMTGSLQWRQQNVAKLGLSDQVAQRLQKMMTQSGWSTKAAWSGKTLDVLAPSFPFAPSGSLMQLDLAGINGGVATEQQATPFLPDATAVNRTYLLKNNTIVICHAEQVVRGGQVAAWMEWQITLEAKP